jgi:hypothetical protein
MPNTKEQAMSEEVRDQVLISYSHKNQAFVDRLVHDLEAKQIKTWVDSDDIPSGSVWEERIQRGIEKANNFIFVVSQDSIQSEYCKKELKYAIQNGKRLIPIAIKHIDPSILPELSARQWTFFEDQVDDFQQSFTKLEAAIKKDQEWVDAHSDLQIRALEWEKSNRRNSSILLRGKELQNAEDWLARIGPKTDPQPTRLQREFVLKSRQDATSQQRRSLTAISIALVLVIGLAIVAFVLRGVAASEANMRATAQVAAELAEKKAVVERDLKATEQVKAVNAEATAVAERDLKATAQVVAESQRDIAISRLARILIADQFDLGLLLAIEASLGPSSDGLTSLFDLLQAEPGLVRIVSGAEGYIWQGADTGFIDSLALSPDGNQLVAKSYLGAMFWDLNTGQSQVLDGGEYQQYSDTWSPQESATLEQEQFQVLDVYRFSGPSTAVSNRKAFSACRTMPSAGGAPGCASLIYVFETGFKPLITLLASCSPAATPSDFRVELEGGLFRIWKAQTAEGQPADFELYSVALANKASNQGSVLAGILYDPQHNWMVTASKVERHFSELALIVWDLDEKIQVLELFTPFEQGPSAAINFSNAGAEVDICDEFGTGIQINLNPDSWREKACKIAGRNLTQNEWRQFFGDKPYHQTCPQWP